MQVCQFFRFLKNNSWSHSPDQNVVYIPKIINNGSVVWQLTKSVSQWVSQPASQSLTDCLLYIVGWSATSINFHLNSLFGESRDPMTFEGLISENLFPFLHVCIWFFTAILSSFIHAELSRYFKLQYFFLHHSITKYCKRFIFLLTYGTEIVILGCWILCWFVKGFFSLSEPLPCDFCQTFPFIYNALMTEHKRSEDKITINFPTLPFTAIHSPLHLGILL